MRLLTRLQSQTVDERAHREFGIAPEALMEEAGRAVAEEVHRLISNTKKRVLVLVGPGNNGADGFVAARFLKRRGFANIRCVLLEVRPQPSPLWTQQRERAKLAEVSIFQRSYDQLPIEISEADVVIDAIYGTGLDRPLSRPLQDFIVALNKKKKKNLMVAVDVPSGLNVDTGWPLGAAVKADITVTFGLAKPGFFICEGPRLTGRVRVHKIGFPEKLLREEACTHFAFGAQAAKKLLPSRPLQKHKGNFGHLVVAAGSPAYRGAGILSANAAGRIGAGYVTLASFGEIFPEFLQIPEVIYRDLERVSLRSLKATAFAVGPGLGVNEATRDLILKLKKEKYEKVILDADAITTCAEYRLWPLPPSWVITPHAGEMKRIFSDTPVKVEDFDKDRFVWAMKAADRCGCVVLFKGFRTVVAVKDQAVVILAGNSALAKAGSGDVLTGFIGGLMAQGLASLPAACLATYVHGRLADEWLRQGKDVLSLLPSDLTERVPSLLHSLRSSLKK